MKHFNIGHRKKYLIPDFTKNKNTEKPTCNWFYRNQSVNKLINLSWILRIWLIIFICLATTGINQASLGDVWIVDEGTSIRFKIHCDDGDDHPDKVQVKLDGALLFVLSDGTKNYPQLTYKDIDDSSVGWDGYYDNSKGSFSWSLDDSDGGNDYYYVRWYPNLDEGNILTFTTNYDDEIEALYLENGFPGPENLQIGFDADGNGELSWENSAYYTTCIDEGIGDKHEIVIKRDDTEVARLDGSQTTHVDTGYGESYIVVYEITSSGNVYTSKEGGGDSGDLPLVEKPVGLKASKGRCDGIIKVSWDYSGQHAPETFNLDAGGTIVEVAGDIRQYEHEVGDHTTQSYSIQAVGTMNMSEFSSPCEGNTFGNPETPQNFSASVSGKSIILSWDDVDYENKYIINRISADGEMEFEISEDETSYTDNNVNSCVTYTYQLLTANQCTNEAGISGIEADNPQHQRLSPDLNNYIEAFDASKAYFPDKVLLEWEVDDDNLSYVDNFVIKRRRAGSGDEFKVVATVSGQATYEDKTAIGGLMYEYRILGTLECEDDILKSDIVTAFGFRKPYGIVNGKVSYESGVNVKGVEVLAEKQASATGTSLHFDGNGSVTVTDNAILKPDSAIAVEAWIRTETTSGTADIVNKMSGSNGYKLFRDGSDVVFTISINGSEKEVKAFDALKVDKYTHVAGVYDSSAVDIYINGQVPRDTGYVVEAADTTALAGAYNISSDILILLDNMIDVNYSDFENFKSDLIDRVGEAQAGRLIPLMVEYITEIEKKDNAYTSAEGMIDHTSADLVIGDNFTGNIDEIRIWRQSRNAERVLFDYKRIVGNNAPGIAAYWRCDENFGEYIYDVAKSDDKFHKNDGKFSNIFNVQWSSNIPSKRHLGWMGKTDEKGNYTIPYIPYIGSGENFTLTPRFEQHEFDPNTKSVFLGEGSAIANEMNFTDISSFKVTGTVFYEGTYCGVEGAIMGVDGEPVIKNGQPVYTDQNGEFEITVPIGEHYVNVQKTQHVFKSDKFPPGPEENTFNFSEDITGINFIDTTRIKVVGRVVGGTREGDKDPGLGLSKNNIGVANFTFESAKGCGAAFEIETDPETGEFSQEMPPMVYLVKDFDVPENPNVYTYFNNEFPEADFSLVSPEKTATHTYNGTVNAYISINTIDEKVTMDIEGVEDQVVINDVDIIHEGKTARFRYNESVWEMALDPDKVVNQYTKKIEGNYKTDSVTYNYRYDLIYRKPPEIRVTGTDSISPFTGEKEIQYEDPVSKTLKTFNVKDNPLYYPVFVAGKEYSLIVFAEEIYHNYDDPLDVKTDKVPVNDGVLKINNQLAIHQQPEPVSLKNGTAMYTFKGGEPKTLTDANYPWRNYTNVLNMAVDIDGQLIAWKPVESKSDLNFAYPLPSLREDDMWFRGYVMGANPIEGSDFVTNGPAVVDMILRDPPGSESYSYLTKGSSFSFEQSLSTATDFTESFQTSIELGINFESGIGYVIETATENTLNVGFTSTQSKVNSNTLSQTYTSTQTWQTSASPELAGPPSDLFFGSSKNFTVSIADNLTILPVDFIDQLGLPSAGKNAGGFKICLNRTLMAAPKGSATHFIYTADHIENYLIPNLIALRNNLFINNPAYTSNIPNSHELYGSNNDDPGWEEQATSDDPVNTDMSKDYDGPSYTYTPQEYTTNSRGESKPKNPDKIREYNQQIRLWRDALERNEMEKYHADPIKNISYDAGPTFEQSTETNVTQSHTSTFEVSYNPEVSLNFGLGIAGVGVHNQIGFSFNYTTGKTTTRTTTQTNEFGYVLHDPDQGDYFSVDIKDAGTGTGPVFAIKGGRSMCPHEKATPLNYYEPTKHTISDIEINLLNDMNAKDNFIDIISWNKKTGEHTFDDIKDDFPITDEVKSLIPGDAVFNVTQINGNQFNNKLDLALAIENMINLHMDMSLEQNQDFGDDIADNLDNMDQSDIQDMSGQIDMDQNNGFSKIYVFSPDQRKKLLKEWARYREYIYDITASPVKEPEPIGNSTIRREVPIVDISPAIRGNIPEDNLAYFTIQFGNNSYTNEGMTYVAQILEHTNPDGAVIKMDGANVNRGITVDGGEQINKTISVGIGKPDVYHYDSLQIVFYSPCEWAFSGNGAPLAPEAIDTVTFSVHFVPACTDVDIARPVDKFIINTDDEHLVNGVKQTKVPVLLSDYNLGNSTFEKLNFQFKAKANPDWIIPENYYVSPEDDQIEIPGDFTDLEWDVSGYPDGEYNIRAKTYCGTNPDGTQIFDLSEVWTGVVDRKRPQVFGSPQPADGILSPDDDIKIEFSEEISQGILSKLANFDIRGILNGTEIRHDVSTGFDDNTQNFVRIPDGINFSTKSFTIEFWLKNARSHVDECILSQSTNPDDALAIRLNSNGHFEFQVGDVTYEEDGVSAADILDEWHHFAFVYDRVRKEVIVMMDGVPLGNGNMDVAYSGFGDIYLGKSLIHDPDPFQGNLHELRIWERPRTESAIAANMLVTLSGKETGLIGYWPFDDAHGKIAVDKVHKRNASVFSSWDILPSGYAATFNSASKGFIDLDFSDVAFNREQDFSIEFWFKSDDATNTCFMSNGHGDNNDNIMYYITPEDLLNIEKVMPLEDNVIDQFQPLLNTIYSDEENFLDEVGVHFGVNKTTKYKEQILRFSKRLPTYWCINTDAGGNIQVSNNGKRIKYEGENYFDNHWHHFALVVERGGNTRLFIDGELKISEPSTEWNGFGAARFFIGARGLFKQNIAGYEFDQFFNGSLDEVRIWNTVLKQTQIQRNSNMRLDGDELGLSAYLPFESYEEVMGIPLINGVMKDVTDPTRESITNAGVLTQNTKVPNVRMSRPSSKVDFDFVSKSDRVAFVLNEPVAKIENCILDITTKNVEDLYGNTMGSPVTWSAFIDMNQMKWDEQQFDLEKKLYEPMEFIATIRNSSGQQQNFSIENLPGWLTASPREGTLDPLTYKEITFTVNPGINIGRYSQNIALKTDFDFNEKLLLNLRVFKELPYDWEYDANDYQYSMNLIGRVIIEDIISVDKYDKVAAFVDGECRGIANLSYIEDYDMYEAFLDVYSNKESGERYEIRIWDASTGTEYTHVLTSGLDDAEEPYFQEYVFRSNEAYGSPAVPLDLHATKQVIQKIELNKGWNWLSFNLELDPNKPLSLLLDGLEPSYGDMIKSIDLYTQYSNGWMGNLMFLNNEDMYMFKNEKADTLVITGYPVDTEETPVDIEEGWNWIGYTPQVNIEINEALGRINPNEEDLIKSQYAFSMYDPYMGWVGSLDFLRPHQGYMFRYLPVNGAPAEQQLVYPKQGMFKSGNKSTGFDSTLLTEINPAEFRHNMSVVAKVDSGHGIPDLDKYVLMAYHNGECRGVATPEFTSKSVNPYYFLMVYSSNTDEEGFTFKLKSDYNDSILMNETISFTANDVIGTINGPFLLTPEENSLSSAVHNAHGSRLSAKVFPNPFDNDVAVNVYSPSCQHVVIRIFDLQGRIVTQLYNGILPAGNHMLNWDGKDEYNLAVSKGVFFVKVSSDNGQFIEKLIKIR